MKLLLDTHTLLWWFNDNPALSEKARKAIIAEDNIVFVSAATAWEISIKKAIGRLKAPDNFEEALEVDHILQLPITFSHAMEVSKLPKHHQDPFDRILAAQAKVEGLTLVTRDMNLLKYDISLIKA